MANAGPGTNGSQFFMGYEDSRLPPNYTVFGTIDQTGLATLDKTTAAGVAGGGQDGKPATDLTITSVRLDSRGRRLRRARAVQSGHGHVNHPRTNTTKSNM